MHAVVLGRGALPLFLLVLLLPLQRAPCVEHAAEEALLALDHIPVESLGLEAPGKVLGLVGHLARTRHRPAAAHLFELLAQRTLLRAELPETLLHALRAGHRQQS